MNTIINTPSWGATDAFKNNDQKSAQTTITVKDTVGKVLNSHDILWLTKEEQQLFIPLFAKEYWVDFKMEVFPTENVVSHTSLKCILTDTQWNQYFLKQKPEYAIDNQNFAYDFQSQLSNALDCIPSIIPTKDGHHYCQIGWKYYFLTPFIDGKNFNGSIEQSISCAVALSQIHNTSLQLQNSNASAKSVKDYISYLSELLSSQNPSHETLSKLLVKADTYARQYDTPMKDVQHIKPIHRDFSPYNIVFDENDHVIGVNDFDNCSYGPESIDVAEMLLTHTSINYAGTTSHMREPISRFFDANRFEKMLQTYINSRDNFNITILADIPHNMTLIWIELLLVGLLRWDFSVNHVSENIDFAKKIFSQSQSIIQNIMNTIEYQQFSHKWQQKLKISMPEYSNEIQKFVTDEKLWLKHSFEVYQTARNLCWTMNMKDTEIDMTVIEYLAIFHDIWKFFQELHSLENISIAENVFSLFATKNTLSPEVVQKVCDGIRWSDFYNYRLDPSSHPPTFIEWDILRCADKMQDNLVAKVDRYWFEYGVPRWATFFDSSLTKEERAQFSFDNFLWDQLNVILSIIWLRKEDFSNKFLSQAYGDWSMPEKQKVIERILQLAETLWYDKNERQQIQEIIDWYRITFNC